MNDLSEVRDSIKTLIESQREVATEAVIDIMTETCTAIGQMIVEYEENSWENLFMGDKSTPWLTEDELRLINEKSREGELQEWFRSLDNQRLVAMASRFLDFDKMRREAFRQKFPSSFKKWSEEDDAILRDMYESNCPWDEMSSFFGRNINAVKLRLQKLGFDLGPETAYPRFRTRNQSKE